MKKLLAVVLAVVMCTAALLTFVSAEDVAGTEYVLQPLGTENNFTFNEILRAIPENWADYDPTANFSIADMKASVIAEGIITDTYTDPNGTESNDAFSVTEGGDIYTRVRSGICKVITFTAPVAGTYTVSFDVRTFWRAAAFTSVGNTDLALVKEFAHDADDNFSATVELKAGETYNLGLSRACGDNNEWVYPNTDDVGFTAKNFKVTLDAVSAGGTEPEDPKTDPVVYDFIEAFKNKDLEGSHFSPVMIHHVHGNISDHYTWYDGSDESKKNAATGKALVGYRNYNSDEGAYNDVALQDGNVWWYSPNAMDNVICFTAPVDGVYTYDFDTAGISGWGGAAHSSMDFYVQSGETMLHEAHYQKGTSEADVATKWTGTITLKAGETIYFACSSGEDGNSAGDNCVLNKLQVALVEEIKAPDTNDALVAVIALAAVAGTALVISKKH